MSLAFLTVNFTVGVFQKIEDREAQMYYVLKHSLEEWFSNFSALESPGEFVKI